VILKKLILNNIGRYSNQEIDFSEETISLIIGENGSGKSTIFEAILWCIFGKTAKEISVDEIVRLGKSEGKVELILQEGDRQYQIIRLRDVKKQVSRLQFLVDGEDYSGATIADTETKIQEHLKTDFVTFKNSIFFGQEEVNQFVNGTDKERKDILTKFLDLSIYDKALVKVKEKKISITQKIQSLESSKSQMSIQLEHSTLTEKTIEETQQNLDRLQNQKNIELQSLEQTKASYTANLQEQQLKLDTLNALKSHRDKINTLYYDVQEKVNRLKQFRVDLDALDEDIKNQTTSNTDCPTCAQKITIESQKNVRKNIVKAGNTLKFEVDQIFIDLAIPEVTNFQQLAQTLSKINTEIAATPAFERSCSDYKSAIAQCNPEIIQKQYDPQIESLTSHLETQKKLLQNMSTYKETIQKNTQEIERLQKSLENYSELEIAFGPNGIKTLIIENVLTSLEEKINYYINDLILGISVSLETQVQTKAKTIKEKFAIFVHDTHGKREFRTYSGGEKRTISIGIRFAFAELALERTESNFQFLLLDEVTDAFDEQRKETFYNLLTKLSRRYSQIFVISHDHAFKDLFDNSLLVTKDSAGISSIQED
jgi:DNA repair exonuclease SbcCD ATPase subunit